MNLPNFSGDTNPFMPCFDANGNYKKVFKIPIGDYSEKKVKKILQKLRKTF